jgi:hypothetical protein
MSRRFRLRDTHRSLDSGERHAYAWAQDVRRSRIGLAGFFIVYPFYGADLSNQVRYVGDLRRRTHEFTDYRTCAAWRDAVNRGRYDYLVTMPPFPEFPEPVAARWTIGEPAAVPILHMGKVAVFRITGRLDPGTCPAGIVQIPGPLESAASIRPDRGR